MAHSQPMEALVWVMEGTSHYRPDPSDRPRQCYISYKPVENESSVVSPAMAWVHRPERLLIALERRWFQESKVDEEKAPEVFKVLEDWLKDESMWPTLKKIAEVLEKNYGQEFKAYKRLELAKRLEAIPVAVAAQAKPRF